MTACPALAESALAAMLACLLLREILICLLPDCVAGPGGTFIDTGEDLD